MSQRHLLGAGASCWAGSRSIAWQRPTLPEPCGSSTIGAGGLNGRVRDGYAWFPSAIITKHEEDGLLRIKRIFMKGDASCGSGVPLQEYSLKTGCERVGEEGAGAGLWAMQPDESVGKPSTD